MTADQRKKRVNAASLVGCTSREQYRVNRKKMHVQRDLNMRPNISLEWDIKKKSVVSKREQIGISLRQLIPFIEPGPHRHSVLADVVSVPQEIFELENLSEVISYEVWQNLLSDKEISFLSQFLPRELEPDAVVQDLLAGDNFHFGSPIKKWGSSLCYGELHPDNILHKEQLLKAGKKEYYSDLEKYHHDMIETLHTWKEKWASCKDPEVEIVQNMWSSKIHAERSMPPSETRFCGTEDNLVDTPESCSWANSEIAYSSDNQNLGTLHGESRRRKDFLSKKSDKASRGLMGATTVLRKGERLHKRNIEHSDGAKYMSYIKVSREQHERVKSSMKHSGNSFQPRSLNNVLGNIEALNVQPFERFEEEERKKLHEYWLKLANNIIPEAFASWRKSQLQRQEIKRSLGEEIELKVELRETSLDQERETSQSEQMELADDDGEENQPSGEEKDHSNDLIEEQKDNEESINEMETEIEDEKEIKSDFIYGERTHDDAEMIEDDDEDEDEDEDEGVADHAFIQGHNQQQIVSLNNNPRSTMRAPATPDFLQDQHKRQISPLNGNPHTNSMKVESRSTVVCVKTSEDPSIIPEYSGNLKQVDISVTRGVSLPLASNAWPVGDVHGSYYQTTATNAAYASAQQLSIGHHQFIQEQTERMLNLETNRQGKDAGKDLLHRQPDDMSFFSAYPNQDRSELLPTFFKDQNNIPYHHQQKHPGLEFQPGNDLMIEAGQFPAHFREQVHPPLPLDLRQKRLNDLYMHQNIQESMYSGSRFAIPRQEDLPVNIHDWANVNSVRMPVPSQPGELGQNWYTGENGNRGGWPALDAVGVNHSISSGSNSDQTLFSVLSECSELRPRSSYEAMTPTERLIQTGNFSAISGGIPSSSNFVQQSPNPLNYLSGHDAGGGIKMNNLGWIGVPQQNPGIQESIGKPFLRSWNQ